MSLLDLVKYGRDEERKKIAHIAVLNYRSAEILRRNAEIKGDKEEAILNLGRRDAFGYIANQLDPKLFKHHEDIVNRLIRRNLRERKEKND